MLIIRVLIFFVMVFMVSTVVTYNLSKNMMFVTIQAKNQVIENQNQSIQMLIEQNSKLEIVNTELKEIVKGGIKSGCLKNSVSNNQL